MKTLITAAMMLTAASLASFAVAQAPYADPKKPDYASTAPLAPAAPTGGVYVVPPVTGAVLPGGPTVVPDGRAMASDQQVAEARRHYRAQCNRHESAGFCDCVTAGVAQALAPSEVRIAANTISERITAQGDAYGAADSDATPNAVSSQESIEQVEAHYADACGQFRS
jgi:hypothetical protein